MVNEEIMFRFSDFVYQILRGAKFTGTNRFSIEQYAKAGGFKNALQDFESVKFADVRKGIERVPQWQFGKKVRYPFKNIFWFFDDHPVMKLVGGTKMSHVTRKPVFEVCDPVRLKPIWSATGTSQGFEILDIASIDIIRSKQRTIKALIRLRGWAGWSAPLLFAYGKNRFSHDVAQIIVVDRGPQTFLGYKHVRLSPLKHHPFWVVSRLNKNVRF